MAVETLPRPKAVRLPARPKAVLFDWDNTLVDSWPCIIEALNTTLTTMGHQPWTVAECHERVALSLRESFPPLFGDRWQEAQKMYLDSFAAVHLDRLTPFQESEILLQGLQRAGIYCAVVSNKTGRFLRAEVEHLGWGRYFSRLVGAGDATRDKPAADPVILALENSGISPGTDVWFVGDAAVDMQCAAHTGCIPVLLQPIPSESPAFATFPPRLSFTNHSELLACFD